MERGEREREERERARNKQTNVWRTQGSLVQEYLNLLVDNGSCGLAGIVLQNKFGTQSRKHT